MYIIMHTKFHCVCTNYNILNLQLGYGNSCVVM